MSDVKKKVLSIFEKLRNMEGLLSPPALAEILNLKVDTLQKRRSRKVRPWWITLSANRVAYDPSEVASWLQTLSTAPEDVAEETQEEPEEWNEPEKPKLVEVYDSRVGRRVVKKVGS